MTAENQVTIRKELFNIEAEQAVLGTIILNNEYLNRVSEFLREEHFYEPAHRNIFIQILHNVEKVNIVANQVTLKQFFESDPAIKSAGGALYLSTLLASASSIIDIAVVNFSIESMDHFPATRRFSASLILGGTIEDTSPP